jgi:hypothetical protein
VPRLVARFARRLAVPFVVPVLVNGCGVVAATTFTVGDGGAVTDARATDGTGALALDASSCQPADVETYVPGVYHSAAAAWQGACTPDEISAFYMDCLGPSATAATCSAFTATDASGASCAACIVTPDSASVYGPLISHGTFITSNVAGCIQLTMPGELSCAKDEAALVGCELAACEANCPVEDALTRQAYGACASAADSAGCQSYAQMTQCAQPAQEDAGEDAGAGSVCLQSFTAFYDAVVKLFCASPTQDAGTVLVDAAGAADGGAEAAGHDGGGRDATVSDTPN